MLLSLPYGRSAQTAEIADEGLLADVAVASAPSIEDPARAFLRAAENPHGRALEDAIRPGERVLIITVDHTRPNPSPVLRPLIERIESLGAHPELMIALGNHRPMTGPELQAFLGVTEAHQNASREPGQWSLGTTRHGSPIEVSPILRDFDRRILLGFVEPHYIAGFSGGRKLILPGCASRAATTHNHFLTMIHGPQLGRLAGNPIHDDMLDAARAVGVDWTVNIVVNADDSFHSIHCGDLEAAHEAAVRDCEALYATTVPDRADVVVTSPGGWPYDMDMVQAKKALAPALECLKPGGAVILIGECERGWGATQPDRDLLCPGSAPQARQEIEDQLRRGEVRRDWAACSPGAMFMRVVQDMDAQLIVVSAMPDALAGTYLTPAPDLATALRIARDRVGPDARIIAIRDGRRAICRVA